MSQPNKAATKRPAVNHSVRTHLVLPHCVGSKLTAGLYDKNSTTQHVVGVRFSDIACFHVSIQPFRTVPNA